MNNINKITYNLNLLINHKYNKIPNPISLFIKPRISNKFNSPNNKFNNHNNKLIIKIIMIKLLKKH